MSRRFLTALSLSVIFSASASAQGVVLAPDGKPLRVNRVRALIVFQELGGFGHVQQQPNREDLLIELELAEKAPTGAVWLLAAPGKPTVRPAAAAALDEVAKWWRAASAGPAAEAWPPASAGGSPVPPIFGAPEGAPRDFLNARGIALDAAAEALLAELAAAGWGFAAADVPAGERRLTAHLSFTSVCALFPGALGASPGGDGGRGAWKLPPLELMVLHNHFINVDDNPGGLSAKVGLSRLYQDEGTLVDAHLWADPRKDRVGRVRDAAANLGEAAGFVGRISPAGRFLLTVVGGEPVAPARKALDFTIFSHYPTAVDPLPPGRSALWLLGTLVVVVILTAVLLRRRGLAQ